MLQNQHVPTEHPVLLCARAVPLQRTVDRHLEFLGPIKDCVGLCERDAMRGGETFERLSPQADDIGVRAACIKVDKTRLAEPVLQMENTTLERDCHDLGMFVTGREQDCR